MQTHKVKTFLKENAKIIKSMVILIILYYYEELVTLQKVTRNLGFHDR